MLDPFTSLALIQKVETMMDGGFRVKIELPEISATDAAQLFAFKGKNVKVYFEEEE